ncbi:translation initiation factor IF-2-like [Onychomys torridus]|uniref:translation initiation factor IF-2-like n=1 Tax=Onychomys torridus TaxID=38674 RepID=UPI00167FB493|nr:translation initiation factor IF-2-like [Onychomys torridus]
MLSVLPTSWQQQHGPGRRRRCGNGAARVAEPVFAPARRPREALPASRSAPRPSPGRERVTGAGARERGPPWRGGSGAPAARPARSAARSGAARRGEGPPGPDAAGGTREATARRGAQIALFTRCPTALLATLAIGFHCLHKIRITPRSWRV